MVLDHEALSDHPAAAQMVGGVEVLDADHLVALVLVAHHDAVLTEAAVHDFLLVHLLEYFAELKHHAACKLDFAGAAQKVVRHYATELLLAFL